MSLDEYEALLAEKKAALNKKAATRTVDISEFANLKAVNKDEEEEENPLEVRSGWDKGSGEASSCTAPAPKQMFSCSDAGKAVMVVVHGRATAAGGAGLLFVEHVLPMSSV
jgi:hypothetical protein